MPDKTMNVQVYRIGPTFHLCLPLRYAWNGHPLTITTEDLDTSAWPRLLEQYIPNDGTTKWVEFDCTTPGTELN